MTITPPFPYFGGAYTFARGLFDELESVPQEVAAD